jgi:hypothetical protein
MWPNARNRFDHPPHFLACPHNLLGFPPGRGTHGRLTTFRCTILQSIPGVALGLPYSTVLVSYLEYVRFAMDKARQRAVSILLFFGGILVLWATWDFPEKSSPQVK